MNDEERQKALECCLLGDCMSCPIIRFQNCWIMLKDEMFSHLNRQQERIEELEIITGLANNRKHYRKFVDEVFCKQKGKELSEPDFDYIYQLYFEQQAEIEQLKRNLSQCENGYSQELHLARCKLEELKNFCTSKDAVAKELRAVNERLKAVIDDLKHEIRNLECEKGQLEGNIDFLVEQAKFEAIKEFAERIKAELSFGKYITAKQIDEILLEMAGEQDA